MQACNSAGVYSNSLQVIMQSLELLLMHLLLCHAALPCHLHVHYIVSQQ